MNYIWIGMMLIAMITGICTGNFEVCVNAGIDAAKNSIMSVAGFAGIICLWSGLLKIAENIGAINAIGRLFKPVLKRLFPTVPYGSKAMGYITTNLACNFLGLGNAATPAGISAMGELKKYSKDGDKASDPMCMLIILNTASIQLIPTTMIALRASAGSANPSDILVPVWICSILSVIFGVLAAKFFMQTKKKRIKIKDITR